MESLATVAPYLAGPGAGLLVCVLVGLGGYKLTSDKILPLVEGAVARHLDQIDTMMRQHADEHRAILSAVEAIREDLARARGDTSPGVQK